jgi:hypothetical protein
MRLSRWRLKARIDHGVTPLRQDDVGMFDGRARAVRQPRETPRQVDSSGLCH